MRGDVLCIGCGRPKPADVQGVTGPTLVACLECEASRGDARLGEKLWTARLAVGEPLALAWAIQPPSRVPAEVVSLDPLRFDLEGLAAAFPFLGMDLSGEPANATWSPTRLLCLTCGQWCLSGSHWMVGGVGLCEFCLLFGLMDRVTYTTRVETLMGLIDVISLEDSASEASS